MPHQYGPPISADDLAAKVTSVKASLEPMGPDHRPGVTVEVITSDPYTNVLGVVTAVGFKYGDVLLTVEPKAPPPRSTRVSQLAAIIRAVDGNHDLGAAALAEALIDKGVLPTRDW
jgi:hypothetical protein